MTRGPVVMLTSSYPRFPGDGIGTFVEPIAHGVAALGNDVHIVAPWHPLIQRPSREDKVNFHFFRYAPLRSLHAFGYATSLKADVSLRPTAYLAAPLALGAGWHTVRRVVQKTRASILHAHWVVPSGVIAALAWTKIPLIISLHGSDVFMAETNRLARTAARLAFDRAGWITACSEDLRRRAVALGANPERTEVVPYGVDTDRFRPDRQVRAAVRQFRGIADNAPVLVTVGRLVRKKGFEFVIGAMASLTNRWPTLQLFIIGQGDLETALRQQTKSLGIENRIVFLGALPQNEVAEWLSAADVAVVPSVHDDAGNVDGLPNVLLESLSSGTPVVATNVGGISSAITNGVTALLVAEQDRQALADSIEQLLERPLFAAEIGRAARTKMSSAYTWNQVAKRLTSAYTRAAET